MMNVEMKIGVVRKIDPLGRVVIPKEMRDRLGLNEYNNIEFIACDGEHILLKKVERNLDFPTKIDEVCYKIWENVDCLGIDKCSTFEKELRKIKEDIVETLIVNGYM